MKFEWNREYLHKRALRFKSADHRELYKASKNLVTLKIREEKGDFVEEAIDQCTNRSEDMWPLIKPFYHRNSICHHAYNHKLKAVLLHLLNLWLNVLMISSVAWSMKLVNIWWFFFFHNLKPPGSLKIPKK